MAAGKMWNGKKRVGVMTQRRPRKYTKKVSPSIKKFVKKAIGDHFRCVMHNNSSIPVWVRLLLLKTKETGLITSSSLILEDVAGNPTSVSSIPGLNALYHGINKDKYTPIIDKKIKFASVADTSGNNTKLIQQFSKLHNQKINYSGTATDSADWRYHLVFINCEGPDDTGAGVTMECSFVNRFYYTDA